MKEYVQKADIEIRIKPSDLPHNQLDCMPLVELEYRVIVQVVLDVQHHPDFENNRKRRVRSVYVVTDGVQPFSAFFDEDNRTHKHDNVIEERVQVQDPREFIH